MYVINPKNLLIIIVFDAWVFGVEMKVLISTVFFVLVITSSLGNGIVYHGVPESTIAINDGHQMVNADSYTPHGPINITSNANFSSQGWPGSGISGDPYVIEGLSITADAVCINITDTTVYFEVRDCVISSVGASSNDGIFLDNVTHGTVRNCTIDQHHIGISLHNSNSCILTNNTASSNSGNGFSLSYSDNCILTHNTASNNVWGFHLSHSGNCTLTHNAAPNNHYGFYMVSSSGCILTHNTAFNNIYGFHLRESSSCTLTHNIASSNALFGFYLYSPDNYTLTNNTASSNDFGFDVNYADHCILTDNTASSNTVSGFSVSGFNCTLIHNTASSNTGESTNGDGFYLFGSVSCTLTNNTASNNTYAGFYVQYSNNCTLTHNTASSNLRYGIRLAIDGDYNIIYLNRLGDNGESNARDDGESNAWDDGISMGNYWMDYNGSGTYPIPGDAGSVDNYPFVWVPETTMSTTTGDVWNTILILVFSGVGIIAAAIVVTVVYRKRRT